MVDNSLYEDDGTIRIVGFTYAEASVQGSRQMGLFSFSREDDDHGQEMRARSGRLLKEREGQTTRQQSFSVPAS